MVGTTWSTPEPFYTLPGAFDRNRIIPTEKNDGVIFPCYNTSTNAGYSFLLRSKFSSSTWTRTDIPMSNNLVQPSIIRLKNSSHLRTFFRDRNAISIYYADSNDDGHTWTTPKPTILPNNNAGIEAYVLKNGAVIIAFNSRNGTKEPRSPLTVALSYDDGMTGPYHRDVQIHDDDGSHIGEYSYPSLLQSFWSGSDDNDIHLVYTYDRQTIKYIRFNEKWIKQDK
jgi:predicted neuraminidase